MLEQHQQDTCETQDFLTDSNLCFSDLTDSLNSLNSCSIYWKLHYNELLCYWELKIIKWYFPPNICMDNSSFMGPQMQLTWTSVISGLGLNMDPCRFFFWFWDLKITATCTNATKRICTHLWGHQQTTNLQNEIWSERFRLFTWIIRISRI